MIAFSLGALGLSLPSYLFQDIGDHVHFHAIGPRNDVCTSDRSISKGVGHFGVDNHTDLSAVVHIH